MAGFQVTLYGRIWVTPEAVQAFEGEPRKRRGRAALAKSSDLSGYTRERAWRQHTSGPSRPAVVDTGCTVSACGGSLCRRPLDFADLV